MRLIAINRLTALKNSKQNED